MNASNTNLPNPHMLAPLAPRPIADIPQGRTEHLDAVQADQTLQAVQHLGVLLRDAQHPASTGDAGAVYHLGRRYQQIGSCCSCSGSSTVVVGGGWLCVVRVSSSNW